MLLDFAYAPARDSGPARQHRVPRPRDIAVLAALLLAAAVLLLRAFVATPVHIASESMAPTYDAGDVVLVSQQPPPLADLERGELVTFRSPEGGRSALKRVIGLPGDQVVILDSVLHVNGRPVEEPYVDRALIDGYYSQAYTVPEDSVFVLGDNRGNSIDSRDYGAVPADALLGRVLARLWPVG